MFAAVDSGAKIGEVGATVSTLWPVTTVVHTSDGTVVSTVGKVTSVKGKGIPLQALTDFWVSRKLRIQTVGT